jgi:glycosyltransferase EpsJ
MNPLVSVIVPVYNTEIFLAQCIESIINQTYTKIELILINDGSTDKSGALCEEYAKKDSRIIVIHKRNGGVSSARNVGLKQSTGDYIMFVDSDDWLDLNAIVSIISTDKEGKYEVIMYGIFLEALSQGKTLELKKDRHYKQAYNSLKEVRDVLPALIKDESINSMCNKAYKAKAIKGRGITMKESLSIAEDTLFNYQVFMKTETFYLLDTCLYHYAIRDTESLTKRYIKKKYEMLMVANNLIQTEFKKRKCCGDALKAAQHIRIKNVYSCLLDLFAPCCPLNPREKRSYIDEIIKKEVGMNQYNSDSRLFKILIFIFSTKSISLIYITTYIMAKAKRLRKRLWKVC